MESGTGTVEGSLDLRHCCPQLQWFSFRNQKPLKMFASRKQLRAQLSHHINHMDIKEGVIGIGALRTHPAPSVTTKSIVGSWRKPTRVHAPASTHASSISMAPIPLPGITVAGQDIGVEVNMEVKRLRKKELRFTIKQTTANLRSGSSTHSIGVWRDDPAKGHKIQCSACTWEFSSCTERCTICGTEVPFVSNQPTTLKPVTTTYAVISNTGNETLLEVSACNLHDKQKLLTDFMNDHLADDSDSTIGAVQAAVTVGSIWHTQFLQMDCHLEMLDQCRSELEALDMQDGA